MGSQPTDEHAGWYWRVCRVVLTSMPGGTDEHAGWYWRVCRVVLTCMPGDIDEYAGWCCRVILVTSMPGGTDVYAGWYWRVCRVILTSMPGDTDEYAGWYEYAGCTNRADWLTGEPQLITDSEPSNTCLDRSPTTLAALTGLPVSITH